MQGQNVPVFIGIDLGSIFAMSLTCISVINYCEPLSVSGLIRRL